MSTSVALRRETLTSAVGRSCVPATSIGSKAARAACSSKAACRSLPPLRGPSEAHARDRRFVGRTDLVPESHGFRQELLRRGRIALRQAYPPSSEARARDECLALESVGHELQLVGGRAGSIDVAGRDLDLDLRLEQRRPLQLCVRW